MTWRAAGFIPAVPGGTRQDKPGGSPKREGAVRDDVQTRHAATPGRRRSRSGAPAGHVAVIMDGNGRWAQQRGLPRVEGHARGWIACAPPSKSAAARRRTADALLPEQRNWKRPQTELDFLMTLLEQYLIEERRRSCEQNIRFSVIGRREDLPDAVLQRDRREHSPQPGQYRHGPVPGHQLRRPHRDDRRRPHPRRQVRDGVLDPDDDRRGRYLRRAVHGRACPTPTC